MMQSDKIVKKDIGKREAIIVLMVVAVLITLTGLFFGVYCLLNGIKYHVLNYDVPGALFGLVVTFLGVRYCISTYRFGKRLAGINQAFNWDNFKIDRTKK